jgi:hypothetical protein
MPALARWRARRQPRDGTRQRLAATGGGQSRDEGDHRHGMFRGATRRGIGRVIAPV